MVNEVRKWKKKTYIESEILVTDWFYAKTPDLREDEVYAFTKNKKVTIISQRVARSTIEEVDLVLEEEAQKLIEKEKHEKILEKDNSILKVEEAE